MGVTAIWTAVHYRIPLLLVVCNNRSFFNDELHQERVARPQPTAGEPLDRSTDLDPDIDCSGSDARRARSASIP